MQEQQRQHDLGDVDVSHASALRKSQRIVIRRQSEEHANDHRCDERQTNREERERMDEHRAEVELMTDFSSETEEQCHDAGAE